MPTSPVIHGSSVMSELLHGRPALPVDEATRLLERLSRQVAEWHLAGQVHRRIGGSALATGDEGSIRLSPPSPATCLGTDLDDDAELPPEIQRLLPFNLSADLGMARQQLQSAGVWLDPRQIDVYCLGALLCRLLTGEGASGYLRSPRVKSRVPAALQPIMERCLGQENRAGLIDAMELACDLRRVNEIRESGADLDSVPPDQPKDMLPVSRLGRYEIISRIGRGGMGSVYLAREAGGQRRVAIKVLAGRLAADEKFVQRFHAEATAAAGLINPHVIQIYYIGQEAGHHFFSMQYVVGESLAEMLRRRGRLPVDEAVQIAEQALSGLAAAHNRGIVHRDIKPGNILLDAENHRALVADFGLVKSIESQGSESQGFRRTSTGAIMGTVDYIAPEQARGRDVDARADLYSLGVVLFQMLTGTLPFEGDGPTALIFQHIYEAPPALGAVAAGVPTTLEVIVSRLLKKSPDLRYQRAEDVLADLKAFRAGTPLPSGFDRIASAAPVPDPAQTQRRGVPPSNGDVPGSSTTMRFPTAAAAPSRDGTPRDRSISDGQSAPANMQESLAAPGRTIPARQIIAAIACLASLTGMMGIAGKWLAPSAALESQESPLALPAVAGSPTAEKRLAVSADGTMLAASEYDRRAKPPGANQSPQMFSRIRLWNLERGAEGLPVEHPHCSTSLAFSPTGRELVSAGMTPTNEPELKIWDVSSGKLLKRAAVRHSTEAAAVTFSAGGTQVLALVGSALRKTLLTWNVSAERETAGAAELTERTLDAEILAGAFSPSGDLLALSTFHAGNGRQPRIDIYDPSEQRVRRSLSADQTCFGLAFSQDGKLLAAAGSTRIFLWDTATCAEVAASEQILSPAAHLVLSHDGRWLAALDHRNILAVDWRTGTSKPLKPGFSSYAIAFSSADVLIAAPPNSQVAFIDLETGRQVLHSQRTGQ